MAILPTVSRMVRAVPLPANNMAHVWSINILAHAIIFSDVPLNTFGNAGIILSSFNKWFYLYCFGLFYHDAGKIAIYKKIQDNSKKCFTNLKSVIY